MLSKQLIKDINRFFDNDKEEHDLDFTIASLEEACELLTSVLEETEKEQLKNNPSGQEEFAMREPINNNDTVII